VGVLKVLIDFGADVNKALPVRCILFRVVLFYISYLKFIAIFMC